ncbi:hypothetical protein J1N35_008675 [Gossypium stocksii]|uniref:Uncharacterized protein n=1 Tax=Gossypium stocksii TaxID=47602 RepID=A0A9D3W9A7_9ROSI|nr:hypothetical protein J1N35_008675 [Gossypium stocksii]
MSTTNRYIYYLRQFQHFIHNWVMRHNTSSIVLQTLSTSLFYWGGSSLPPPVTTNDDILWQPRTTQHSSIEEWDKDEDEARGEDEDEEHEDSKPQLRRNPPRNQHPLNPGTLSARQRG